MHFPAGANVCITSVLTLALSKMAGGDGAAFAARVARETRALQMSYLKRSL
jgi:hypothetical protein